jgi:hypothetical protein
MEEFYIKKIENGFRGIRLGTKTIESANVQTNLDKLKKLNEFLADDYENKYHKIKSDFNKRN